MIEITRADNNRALAEKCLRRTGSDSAVKPVQADLTAHEFPDRAAGKNKRVAFILRRLHFAKIGVWLRVTKTARAPRSASCDSIADRITNDAVIIIRTGRVTPQLESMPDAHLTSIGSSAYNDTESHVLRSFASHASCCLQTSMNLKTIAVIDG
jgi:hypothetical protein